MNGTIKVTVYSNADRYGKKGLMFTVLTLSHRGHHVC